MNKKNLLFIAAIMLCVMSASGSGRTGEETIKFTFTGENIKFEATAKSIAVDWGDGTEEKLSKLKDTAVRHTYAGEAEHTVRIQTENLSEFYCVGQHLTALDVSNSPSLTGLWCNENQLSALDVSKNTKLTRLNCNGNPLSALDVSKNTKLHSLSCNNNQLSALDVSNNMALTYLTCDDNQLSADALNRIFTDLPKGTERIAITGRISIGGNPGTDTCKHSIAEEKKWRIGYHSVY